MRDTPRTRVLAIALLAALAGGCGSDAPSPPSDEASTPSAPVTARPAARTPAEARAAEAAAIAARNERLRQLNDQRRAAEPEWKPEPAPADGASVDDLLARADAAFAAGNFAREEGNALGLYLSVLETDPAHAAAQAGVANVKAALRERIEAALLERRYEDAAAPMAVLAKLDPDDAQVQALRARVEAGHEIGVMLAEARRLQQAGRLLEPPGDNAAAVYAAVLARDPGEPSAQAGLTRVESELVAQATAAAEAGDYEASDRLLAEAARVRPGSGMVQNAGTRIVELRQDRASELRADALEAAQVGDVGRAEQLLAQLERVSAQAQGIDELRERIEQARLYGGFQPGQALTDSLAGGGSAPEMVVLPVGRFRMGSPADEPQRRKNEGPDHEIALARGFALARTEITVAQFRTFVQASGYRTSAERAGRSTIYDERTGSMAERPGVDWRRDHAGRDAAGDLPVVHVSWEDAKAYADWLTRETGEDYRLPSEAEFEYALRAGKDTRFPWGDGDPPRVLANLTGDADRSATRREWGDAFRNYGDGFWGAAPVRSFEANPFGLHDLEGNVSEWVEDCWHDNYLRAPKDGSAWVNPGCALRIIRGASWASAPDQARSAFRISASAHTTNARVGFRVVREL